MNLNDYIRARGFDPDDLTDDQRTALTADFEAAEARATADAAPPADPPVALTRDDVNDILDARDADAAAARAREITELARIAGVDEATRDAAIGDPAVTLDAARARFAEVLRAARPPVTGLPAVHVAPAADEAARRTVEAGILIRANAGDFAMTRGYDEQTLHTAERSLRGLRLEDVFRHALRLEGRAIPDNRSDLYRAGIGTASLANIVTNVAGVTSIQGALSAQQTWRQFCSVGPLRGFQAEKMVKLDIAGGLTEVGDDGKLSAVSLDDSGEEITGVTRGKVLYISRQHIIDDRIDILTDAPRLLGLGAMNDVSTVVYTLLEANAAMADGTAIFATATETLQESSALAIATVDSAATLMMGQLDSKSQPRHLMPKTLLAPIALLGTARAICSSPDIVVIGVGAAAATQHGKHGYGDGSIAPFTDPRLTSATTWYLFANPAECANIRVGFLDGVQTPTVEPVAAAGDTLAEGFRVYLDYGVAAADRDGMVQSTA